MKQKPLIVLTNDDGFFAPGIEALENRFQDLGEIYIVAPDRERSAASLSLTLHHPIRVKTMRKKVFAVDGTPADCVYLAMQRLLPCKPSLLVSGINAGPNLGKQDTAYSGTVAAAVQGTFLEIPSIAVSQMSDDRRNYEFIDSAEIAYKFAVQLLSSSKFPGYTLNINVPCSPVKGIKAAELGEKRYHPRVIKRRDPRGRDYFWIGTGTPRALGGSHSDVKIIQQGYATVTPLHHDLTEKHYLKSRAFQTLAERINHEMA